MRNKCPGWYPDTRYFLDFVIRNGNHYLFHTLKNPVETGIFFFFEAAYLSWLILYPSEQCLASLQESSFKKMIQMLKTAIIYQLYQWTETSQSYCSLKALLRMMKEVHKVSVPLRECIYHFTQNPSGLGQLESSFVLFLNQK